MTRRANRKGRCGSHVVKLPHLMVSFEIVERNWKTCKNKGKHKETSALETHEDHQWRGGLEMTVVDCWRGVFQERSAKNMAMAPLAAKRVDRPSKIDEKEFSQAVCDAS